MWTLANAKTFVQFSLSKNDSNYLNVKLKVFKKDGNNDFRLVQNLTLGEADFSQFMRLRNQLVIAEENFGREETLYPVLIRTISKDKDEHFKLADKVVDVVDRQSKDLFDSAASQYGQVREFFAQGQFLYARNKEDENFQQIVYVK